METQHPVLLTLRWVGAICFAAIAAFSISGFTVAQWMKNDFLNSERFTSLLAPLAESPQFQTLIATNAATVASTTIIDSTPSSTLESVASGAAGIIDWLPFGTDLAGAVEEFQSGLQEQIYTVVEEQTRAFLRSDAFPPLWEAGLREVHGQLLSTLSGDTETKVGADGTAILTIQIGPLSDVLRESLQEQGVWWAQFIPTFDMEVEVAELYDLPALQQAYRLLPKAEIWLLAAAIMSTVLAIGLAPRRLLIIAIGALKTFAVAAIVWRTLPTYGLKHLRVLVDGNADAVSQQVWSMLTAPVIKSLEAVAGAAVVVAVVVLFVALVFYIFNRRATHH